jgi:hypothetical protein
MITTDQAMRDLGLLPASFVRDLQDAHNVNLHADGDGDEVLDLDPPNEVESAMHETEDLELEELADKVYPLSIV